MSRLFSIQIRYLHFAGSSTTRFMTERERGAKADAGTAFHSNKVGKQKWRDGQKPKCDHCGKIGHTKAKCFEIIRYPADWDTQRAQNMTNKPGAQSNTYLARGDDEKMESSKGTATGHALHGKRIAFQAGIHENMVGNDKQGEEWVLDSGASHHMTPLLSLLRGICKIDKSFYITVPTGSVVLVERMGYVEVVVNVRLKNVLYVLQFSCNLIYVH